MLSRQQRIIAFVTLLSLTLSVTSVWAGRLQFWEGNTADNIAAMKAGTYNPYREFNEWLNDILFGALGLGWLADYVDQKMGGHLAAYYTMVYLRDLVAGTLVYWVTGGLWHLTVYGIFGKTLFDDKKRDYPDPALIRRQQFHAQTSVFVYAGLPALSEFLIESKLTKVYFYVDEIGGMHMYALFFFVYLACVEIGIYWMHRTLHTNKWLYNNIHGPHHSYKTREQLTPWASIAFHPIDGILQASPYVACLFFVPAHYFTHFVMLFFSGVWATNIHDAVPVNSEPIMGAKYHTMHHTHFVYVFCSFFFPSYSLLLPACML
jgi:Delta7-sterol 5-desaturase